MKILFWNVVMELAFLTGSSPAYSHGIATNRYFDGTLTFDDPAVADEAILPYYTYLGHPAQDSKVIEDRLTWRWQASVGKSSELVTPQM
jgi:hypothetical protein